MRPIARRSTFSLGKAKAKIQAGGPQGSSRLIAFFLLGGIAWFLWRPLAAIYIVFAIAGWFRRTAIRLALFWARPAVLIVGTTCGALIAAIIADVTHGLVNNTIGIIGFRVFGFMASGYIGYGASNGPLASPGDDKRSQTSSISVVVYLVLTGVLCWCSDDVPSRHLPHNER